jgi:NAD(P)-dependent dehydrogenase (short-subunit alcohol dehydrogenase family)
LTKTALVTGGSSGIGLESARLLARQCCGHVVVNGQEVERGVQACRQLGEQVAHIRFRFIAAHVSLPDGASTLSGYRALGPNAIDFLITGAPRQKDLALPLGLGSFSVVRPPDLQQTARHVERQEGSDRRAKTIALTPHGKMVVAEVEKVSADARRRLLSVIPPAELGVALAVIVRISEAALGSMKAPA